MCGSLSVPGSQERKGILFAPKVQVDSAGQVISFSFKILKPVVSRDVCFHSELNS